MESTYHLKNMFRFRKILNFLRTIVHHCYKTFIGDVVIYHLRQFFTVVFLYYTLITQIEGIFIILVNKAIQSKPLFEVLSCTDQPQTVSTVKLQFH